MAQDNDERARAYFEAGSEAYAAQNYEEALAQFRRSYAVSGRSALLYNIGQAAERSGHPQLAIDSWTQFLQEEPNSPRFGEVTRNKEMLQAQLDAQNAATEAGEGAAGSGDTPVETTPEGETPTDESATPDATDGDGQGSVTAAPTPEETANAGIEEDPLFEPEVEEESSIIESPIFWVAIGAVVIGGAVLAAVLLSGGDPTINPDQHGAGTLGSVTALTELR